MRKVRNKNVFVWPEADDVDEVEAKFVFEWDVQLDTQNGRLWGAHNMRRIEEQYQKYRETYCS